MRFAYADPPYIGMAKRHYADHPDYAGEVDHEALIARLCAEYDGWALSCSAPTQHYVESLCPEGYRVGIWYKPFASWKPNVQPAFTYEPVIFYGWRPRTREQPTIRDVHVENITLERGLVGAKPEGFCFWVFEWLNLMPGDEFCDMFPGTGGVMAAYERWQQRMVLAPSAPTDGRR